MPAFACRHTVGREVPVNWHHSSIRQPRRESRLACRCLRRRSSSRVVMLRAIVYCAGSSYFSKLQSFNNGRLSPKLPQAATVLHGKQRSAENLVYLAAETDQAAGEFSASDD